MSTAIYEPCPYIPSTAITTLISNDKQIIHICSYTGEEQITQLMQLVAPQLSEPYSIFTYRFFLVGWPQLCFLAHAGDRLVGAIVAKAEREEGILRGYIAMLVVDPDYRKCGIGLKLAELCITKMCETCDEIVLETEVSNVTALRLYEGLGFLRSERLPRYYMNGSDAYRLKCWVKERTINSNMFNIETK